MTKREHQVELEVEVADETLKQLECMRVSVSTVLEGYADALRYGWTEAIKNNPEATALYQMRAFYMERIKEIDDKIDNIVEGTSMEGD